MLQSRNQTCLWSENVGLGGFRVEGLVSALILEPNVWSRGEKRGLNVELETTEISTGKPARRSRNFGFV